MTEPLIPKVAWVRAMTPRCSLCAGTVRVLTGDGPPICRDCIAEQTARVDGEPPTGIERPLR